MNGPNSVGFRTSVSFLSVALSHLAIVAKPTKYAEPTNERRAVADSRHPIELVVSCCGGAKCCSAREFVFALLRTFAAESGRSVAYAALRRISEVAGKRRPRKRSGAW